MSCMTFAASSNAVLYEGGKVVFADCEPDTMNISAASVRSLITARTKAVVAVDMCGGVHNRDEIMAICEENNLILIEDAAHSIGSTYKGKQVGSAGMAHLTTFSFHPVKNMTTGEGGMIVTDDDAFAKRLRVFITHGITRDYKDRQA